jgi:phosphate transport system substrate-binding protein
MKKIPFLFSMLLAGLSTAVLADFGRPYVLAVGSTTMSPYGVAVADRLSSQGVRRPKIESTGTGGGIKVFCEGSGPLTPDIAFASRPMKNAEIAECDANGVKDVISLKVGYDGVVMGQALGNKSFSLTSKEIYLALARTVPDPFCRFCERMVANPHKKWSEINPALPDTPITVYGPPKSSGTRDAFIEDVLVPGCASFPTMAQIQAMNQSKFDRLCQGIREDGAYIEDADRSVVNHLVKGSPALAIFSFQQLNEHVADITPIAIDGAKPSYQTIASQEYHVSRPLYLYVKGQHLGRVDGLERFLSEFTSEKAWGNDGYLTAKGLIAMSEIDRNSERAKLKGLIAEEKPAPKAKKSAKSGK